MAVLDESNEHTVNIDPRDLEIKVCRGSGKGGQKRNVTDCAVQVKHLPTGLTVRVESDRSQQANKRAAITLLSQKLSLKARQEAVESRNRRRKAQVGSGMRGDKRRTVRVQEGKVRDHLTGRVCRVRDYLKGELEKLA